MEVCKGIPESLRALEVGDVRDTYFFIWPKLSAVPL